MEEQNKIKAANTIANWWRNIYNFKTQIWGESMLENYCYNDDGFIDNDSRDSYDDNFLSIEEKLMEKKFSDNYDTDYRFDDEDRFYDFNQKYEVFGSILSATEYSDYVCANTPYDDSDFPNVQVY